MPLTKRVTDVFRVVSIDDSLLDDVPAKVMRQYVYTRDFAVLEPELQKLPKPPTIYTAIPLRPEYDNLAQMLTAENLKSIFAAHVQNIENPDFPGIFVEKEGRRTIKTEAMDEFPNGPIEEIASIIVHKGRFVDRTPFLQQDTWVQGRILRAQKRHVFRTTEDVDTITTVKKIHGQSAPWEIKQNGVQDR